ncbi:DUF6520 family protein [Zhouia spongiae]|uniref:DUF6520 family protein n=1 Tax=Zhouia spongiae TaxID=2202721 RepID=A0ABY3YK71_9FLAO|nr:DUF6520 family protein [Zhouia spongiae]UNY97896.1 DUF6520 family protein [Zhouia spongiae]
MKRIQRFLTAAAFMAAIGGAIASNYDAISDAYRSDNCNQLVEKPLDCTSTDENDPICTLGSFTYYQNQGCVDEWRRPIQ